MAPPTSLLRGGALGGVHCPDDDDLLQAGGRRRRRSQLLHQSVQRVRVDGLLLVGFEGHGVGGGQREVGGLRFELLHDGGVDGLLGGGCVIVDGRSRGFGVGGRRFRVGWPAFGDGSQNFVLLRDFTVNEGHGVAGGQEHDCRETQGSKVKQRNTGVKGQRNTGVKGQRNTGSEVTDELI